MELLLIAITVGVAMAENGNSPALVREAMDAVE
jgi:hypothetical protein